MPSSYTQWSEGANLLLPDMPGLEWPAAQLALKRGARRFFELSGAYREVCDPLVTLAGVPDYDILDIQDVAVIGLREVAVGTDDFESCGTLDRYITPARMNRLHATAASSSAPEYAAWVNGHLWFYGTPSVSDLPIKATLILVPTYKSEGLPNSVWEEHVDQIVKSARAILHASSGKPYTDPNMARELNFELEREAATARHRADTGGAPISGHTRAHFV